MSSTNASFRKAPLVAARFGSTYGYRFEGDTVTLQASVQILHEVAHEVQWRLQLQASPINDSSSQAPLAHTIAGIALPPLAELTGAGDHCSLAALATPPAGQGEFNLSLALISRQAGQPDELHDLVSFSRPERFVQPQLVGSITSAFSQNEVSLSLDRIENPRDPANVSGTLSLELWALSEPYTGGTFQGLPLAGTILGRLSGQEAWSNAVYALHYAPPTPGRWQVAVMLREWTGSSYTTRDFRNLAEPLVIATSPAVPPVEPAPAKPAASLPPPPAAVAPKAAPASTPAPKTAKAAKGSKPAKPGSKAKSSGRSSK